METADIDYQDEAGRVADFHALRHSFITNVVKSGATVKESQTLARHSKAELTLGVYTHIGISDERRALDKMPTLTSPATKSNQGAALKTGTDDIPVSEAEGAYKPAYKKLAKNAYFDNNELASDVAMQGADTAKSSGFDTGDNPLSNEQLGSECPPLTTKKRRGRDSNPRYGRSPIRRFSKPLPENNKTSQTKDLEQGQTGDYKPAYKENPKTGQNDPAPYRLTLPKL